ncbi:hypothetical protein F511_46390 [Dorcoceras hygrometricum]|uniref:Uncharacterized protein n=1 Tax=Dorcoceras hygrometricum TaxID=472368 RepID=A0A2Z6ZTN5_9LAMI|nr:hypothetical protein F511_46390 [Dorcoceras hygrometricum]
MRARARAQPRDSLRTRCARLAAHGDWNIAMRRTIGRANCCAWGARESPLHHARSRDGWAAASSCWSGLCATSGRWLCDDARWPRDGRATLRAAARRACRGVVRLPPRFFRGGGRRSGNVVTADFF